MDCVYFPLILLTASPLVRGDDNTTTSVGWFTSAWDITDLIKNTVTNSTTRTASDYTWSTDRTSLAANNSIAVMQNGVDAQILVLDETRSESRARDNISTTSIGATGISTVNPFSISQSIPQTVNATDVNGAVRLIYLCGMPPIMLAGLLGNGLSFATMRRPTFQTRSTCFYLAALAISDSVLVLYYGIARISVVLSDAIVSPALCSVGYYTYFVSCHSSAWLLVAMTIDRYIHINYPALRLLYCTIKRARIAVICIIGVVMVTNSPNMVAYVVTHADAVKYCDARPSLANFVYNIWPILDAILYSYIPSCFLFILNSLIIYRMWTSKRDTSLTYSLVMSNARRVTIMLLAVTFIFITLTVPVVTYVLGQLLQAKPLFTDPLSAIMDLMFFFNHACNFYIYCLTSREFRSELSAVLCIRSIVTPVVIREDNVNSDLSPGDNHIPIATVPHV